MKTALIIIFLFSIFYFPFFSHSAFAQTNTPYNGNPYTIPDTNPDVPKNLHVWTQTVMLEVISAMNCQIYGTDPTTSDKRCLGFDPNTKKIGYVENSGGAIGFMGNMIAMLYTPPIHTSDYIHYLASNFGIAKKAYAETGYDRLSPLSHLWIYFRNLVYLLFTLVFIITGLGIMFRVNIDPRNVMTIQSQIPKIIVALLLITFSYAIVGLMIDLMYVLIYLLLNVAADKTIYVRPELANDSITKIIQAQRTINTDNPIGIFNNMFGFREVSTNAAGGVKDIVQNIFYQRPDNGSIVILSGLADLWDNVRNVGGWFLGWLFGALALLIIGAALLWSMFRLWFQLLQAYIFLMLDVILAPFWLLGGLVPQGSAGFGPWFRDVIANLIVFPTAIAILMLGRILIDNFKNSPTQFVPPMIGNPGDVSSFSSIIGLGLILIAHQALTITRDVFKAPQLKYTTAIAQALGAGQGMATAPVGAIWSRLTAINPNTGEAHGSVARWFHRSATEPGIGGPRRLIGRLGSLALGVRSP